jgi:protein SCO1/2
MKRALVLLLGLLCWRVVACRSGRAGDALTPGVGRTNMTAFQVAGVLKELKPDGKTAVIRHEAISNYMAAMTMPFHVRDSNQLTGLKQGDRISFRLLVNHDESWIDQVTKTGGNSQPPGKLNEAATRFSVSPRGSPPSDLQKSPTAGAHPLMNYQFTNQLGQPVTLASFQGQALAMTFFFTRCPIPDYCPRLSRNFEEASAKLAALPNGPTNWHFLSVSIDPQMDTPAVLRVYAQRYHYDSNHWSFLTGPLDKIRELARESGVSYEPENGLFNHSFRTLIIDPAGRLQMSFPIAGNLSAALVDEIVKAAAAPK